MLQIEFFDFNLINEILVWLSATGFVLEFKRIPVNPLFDATSEPFSIVSLSSNPGSPKDTLLSNQPLETWRFLILIIVALLSIIDFAIFTILPSWWNNNSLFGPFVF